MAVCFGADVARVLQAEKNENETAMASNEGSTMFFLCLGIQSLHLDLRSSTLPF